MKTTPDRLKRRRIRVAQAIFAGAAVSASLTLLTAAGPAVGETLGSGGIGGIADDPADPGWNPPVDPGSTFPTNPGWSSQSDPGWNADPGWDFQPSP